METLESDPCVRCADIQHAPFIRSQAIGVMPIALYKLTWVPLLAVFASSETQAQIQDGLSSIPVGFLRPELSLRRALLTDLKKRFEQMTPTVCQMLRVIVMLGKSSGLNKSSGPAINASQYAVDSFDHQELASSLLRHLWREPLYVSGSAELP